MSKTFSFCVIAIIVAFTAFSCKKDTDIKTVIYHVEPELTLIGPNPPAPADSPKNIPAMVLIKDGTKDTTYLTLHTIEGFDYEEGYTYTLKVRITRLKNPPADGSIFSYSLVDVISKQKQRNKNLTLGAEINDTGL